MKYVLLVFAWACLLAVTCGAATVIGQIMAKYGFDAPAAIALGAFGLLNFLLWGLFYAVAHDGMREVKYE